MKDINTNWTKEELNIYILIYCANADFSESKFETDFIKSKITTSDYGKIHAEYEKDNDYQSIQKIQSTIKTLGYSNEETNNLFSEIKELFLSDGNYDIMEQNLFKVLGHILK